MTDSSTTVELPTDAGDGDRAACEWRSAHPKRSDPTQRKPHDEGHRDMLPTYIQITPACAPGTKPPAKFDDRQLEDQEP